VGKEEKATKDSQTALQEDFQHLVEQTDLLWQTRSKIAAMRQSRSEARWNALTNAFTYLYVPSSLCSSSTAKLAPIFNVPTQVGHPKSIRMSAAFYVHRGLCFVET
jgi:hypothetical protein